MDPVQLPDREERILARRKRAEAKLKRDKQSDNSNLDQNSKDKKENEQALGRRSVADALAFLERLQFDTSRDLSDIRVKFDADENERRIIEENARLDRYEALQIEAVSSGRKNAAVELKWADLLYIEIPQELHDQLLLQKEACLNILEGKDRRIREFLTELKNKDEEYQKMLKRQSHDVQLMLRKMRSQYVLMQELFEDQLRSVEKAFQQERSDLMRHNREEIEALFERRRHMEESEFLEARSNREQKFQSKINDLREQDSDEFNNSRIALERSVQELEAHLEKMASTYQLNKEKLDYNLQVLIERNKEHSAIQSSYKNRLNRLRETLNSLMSRYAKLDQKYKSENADLSDEYKRLTRQFKDLQTKFSHFESADQAKFRSVWRMNESEAKILISQIFECDKVIHEQQLGISSSFSSGAIVGGDGTGVNKAGHEDGTGLTAITNLSGEREGQSEAGTQTGKSKAMSSQPTDSGGKFGKGASSTKTKKCLDLMKDEAAYLLDMKIKDEIANAPDAAQKDVIQVNAILKYIGVESQDDVDLLVSLFFQGQDDDDENLYVDADDVLRILRDFIQEKENLRITDMSGGGRTGGGGGVGGKSDDELDLRRKQEKKFWEKLGSSLPEMRVRIWKALYKKLESYYKLLSVRSKLVDDAIGLQRDNESLKELLDQYLGSRVNEELQIPPTHVIRVVAGKN